MKILFKQSDIDDSFFACFGVKQCYFKHLLTERDAKSISRKAHHHAFFEIHIIEKGHQIYLVEDKEYNVKCGEILLISPNVKHRLIKSAPQTSKFGITFCAQNIEGIKPCSVGKLERRIRDNVALIVAESEKNFVSSRRIISGCVSESIILLLRACGMKESAERVVADEIDSRLFLAKQFINDNIEQALKVSEIAEYCYLSEKQLTRIFLADGTSPAEYIRMQKVKYIEKLLSDKRLPLKAISEKMNFSSEYYFNRFFKKYSGMTPGEYRRMSKQA